DAYETLRDKSKRARYDQLGFNDPGAFGGAGPGGFQGQGVDPMEILRQFGMGGMGGGAVDLGDFAQAFGGAKRGRGRSRRPMLEPVEADVEVPFLTAALGGTVSLGIGDREVELKVPAGAEEGKKMRLQGQGPHGEDLIARL